MMAVTNIDSISLKTLAVPMEGLYLDITGFSSVSAHTVGRSLGIGFNVILWVKREI